MLKKVLGLGVVVAMLFSTVAMANPPAPTALVGTGTVATPTFAVLLPTAPIIRLDPFGMTQDPIWSPWYVIANRSNVAVRVDVTVGPHSGAAATANTWTNPGAATEDYVRFVADLSGVVSPDNNRYAQLDIIWASGVENMNVIPTGATPTPTPALGTHAIALINTLPFTLGGAGETETLITPVRTDGTGAGLSVTAGDTFVAFLQRHDVGTPGVDQVLGTGANAGIPQALLGEPMTSDQVAAFRFGGEVNTAATWAANNIAARVIFSISAVAYDIFADLGSGATDDYDPFGAALNVRVYSPA